MTPLRFTPIGSFFELANDDLVRDVAEIPWQQPDTSLAYLQSGQQALRACASYLSEVEGRDIVVVPEFACDSMLAPFPQAEWTLVSFPVDASLRPDTHALSTIISQHERCVVLTMAYFGAAPDSEHIATLQILQAKGARVIEDETHRVLTASTRPIGDVAVASLRKTIPVPDGAYLRGVLAPAILEHSAPEGPRSHPGWEAMEAKSAGDLERAGELFTQSDRALSQLEPALLSPRTLEALSRLSHRQLANRRTSNAEALRSALPVNHEILVEASVPSHLPLRVDEPRAMQQALAKQAIYCPIHWPRPPRLAEASFPCDLISLPIDHRYNRADMSRIGTAVRELVNA
ncbi:hypothetical protein ACHAAC_02690 [Aeromicrobium sp. CF4.19]|uniref:hypothetical protein n=1 Tax=Aeromicrobium sp. CF4.19 TaxID=3373082 RepID=UPI003EE4A879